LDRDEPTLATTSEYKGYRIECRLIGKWFAQIFPPGSGKALKDTPVASREEGYDHLLEIAHALIDKKIAAEG
jgi:hypothetical protein